MKYYSVLVKTKQGDYPYFEQAINSDAVCILVRLDHALKGRPEIQTIRVAS